MRKSSDPRTAIQAAAGATPKANPKTKCDQRVNRLVNEYRSTMPRATGESHTASLFSCAAASMKTAHETITKMVTNFCESAPAGMARVAVRGLAASICASASRLNAIAAERAETMHKTIHPSCARVGRPPAASMAPHIANGRANTECSHLIISRVVLMLENIRTLYCTVLFWLWSPSVQ